MNKFTPIWLYLKKHNDTCLLYFKKTKKDTKFSDEHRAKMSGAAEGLCARRKLS